MDAARHQPFPPKKIVLIARRINQYPPKSLYRNREAKPNFSGTIFLKALGIAMLPVIWCQQHVRRGRVTVDDVCAFTAAAIAGKQIGAVLAHGWMVVTEGKLGPVGIVFQFFDLRDVFKDTRGVVAGACKTIRSDHKKS